jgi:hypothetical protein
MWLATGSTSRFQTGIVFSIHSARLQADTTVLTQRTVYILPTRAGWLLGVTLLVLLLGSINYQLNLGYVLTFLLAGSALVGMHVAHATLRGLTLQLHPPPAVFAGTTVRAMVQVHNPGRRTRYAVGLGVWRSEDWALADIPARGSSMLAQHWPAPIHGGHIESIVILPRRVVVWDIERAEIMPIAFDIGPFRYLEAHGAE